MLYANSSCAFAASALVFRKMASQLRCESTRGQDFLALLPVGVIEQSRHLQKAISKKVGGGSGHSQQVSQGR